MILFLLLLLAIPAVFALLYLIIWGGAKFAGAEGISPRKIIGFSILSLVLLFAADFLLSFILGKTEQNTLFLYAARNLITLGVTYGLLVLYFRLSGRQLWRFFVYLIIVGLILSGAISFALQGIPLSSEEVVEKELQDNRLSPEEAVKKELQRVVYERNTANWKTYRNEEFGFEIKYSAGTEIIDIDADTGWFFMSLPFSENVSKLVDKGLQIRVAVSEHDYGVETFASCASQNNIDFIGINGISFVVSDVSNDFAGTQGRAIAREYCAMKDNMAFKLTFTLHYNRFSQLPDFDQEKESVIFNQMLSTFRFIE